MYQIYKKRYDKKCQPAGSAGWYFLLYILNIIAGFQTKICRFLAQKDAAAGAIYGPPLHARKAVL